MKKTQGLRGYDIQVNHDAIVASTRSTETTPSKTLFEQGNTPATIRGKNKQFLYGYVVYHPAI